MSRFELEKKRALALNPNHAETLADVGIHLVVLDRTDEAYQYAQRALQLDPNFPSWVYFVPALHFYRKERYQDALVAAQKINMPEFFNAHVMLAMNYAQLGKLEKARAEAAEVLRLKPDYTVWDAWEIWNMPDSFIEHIADGAAKAGLPLRR